MAHALRAWAINRGGKISVRNLRYGPRTRLVRAIIIWQGKSERSDWFFLGRDFTIRTFSTETVQAVYLILFHECRQIYLHIKLLKENM